jgi:hypothetical protein
VRRVFCPIQGAIFEASAAARGILWKTRKAPNGWKFHPHPLSPHPRHRRAISSAQVDLAAAAARLRRRAVDLPPPRLLPPVLSAPPRCSEPAPPPPLTGTRSGAALLLQAPCSTGDHVLLEPSFNMAHLRCSPKCSQGMRVYRQPTNFARIFCLKHLQQPHLR